MKITRKVILDLLPLYLADEVSDDTRALIEEYLETDPQLAKIAKQSAALDLKENIPFPAKQESQLAAYRKARQLNILYATIFGVVLAAFLMIVVLMFFLRSSQ